MGKEFKKLLGTGKSSREAHLMVCDEFKVDVAEKSLIDWGKGKKLKNRWGRNL